MKEITLCGVRIDNVTPEEAVARALAPGEAPCVTVTPNALMLEACRRSPHHAALLNRATLSLPDGAGVLRAAARKGTPLRTRVAGIDFGFAILAKAEEQGLPVFLLGGAPGVAAEAAGQLRHRFPRLWICGTHHGYFAKEGSEDRAVVEQIRAAAPRILVVCFGFPLQEEWIDQHRAEFPSLRLMAALGGSLDVWAGRVKRAPALLSSHGMEWAWRMLCQPRRLKDLPRLIHFAVKGDSSPHQGP